MADEGLRARKKRRTRQHISDVATGLFVEHGFDAVTVAQIAEAAEVSVNTVYNYFPAKEDLFLDRGPDLVERLSRHVRGRDPGESAAEAVLRELREDVEAVSPKVGLNPAIGRFMVVVEDADALKARLVNLNHRARATLAATLRDETGAAPDDPLPDLIAGQLAWLHESLFAQIRRAMVAGRPLPETSREALGLLDRMEELLSDNVLNYARRPQK